MSIVEPSDQERSEWPDATRAYVEDLEQTFVEMSRANRGLIDQLGTALVERDQLAARVDRLLDYMESLLGTNDGFWRKSKAYHVYHERPEVALLRYEAGITDAIANTKHSCDSLAHGALVYDANTRKKLRARADRLRKQAEAL